MLWDFEICDCNKSIVTVIFVQKYFLLYLTPKRPLSIFSTKLIFENSHIDKKKR